MWPGDAGNAVTQYGMTWAAVKPYPNKCKYHHRRVQILTAITLTKVVFPEHWSPTKVSSISSFQKRDRNQSKILLIMDNIFREFYVDPKSEKSEQIRNQMDSSGRLTVWRNYADKLLTEKQDAQTKMYD